MSGRRRKSKPLSGDRLAYALFCIALAVGLMTSMIERNVIETVAMLTCIAALMVYPIFAFLRGWVARFTALVIMLCCVAAFGKLEWPLPTMPRLTGYLLIDSINNSTISYKLIIDNIGKAAASKILVFENSNPLKVVNLRSKSTKDVIPGAKMEFSGPLIFDTKWPLTLDFLVSYQCAECTEYKDWHVAFRFISLARIAPVEQLEPAGMEEGPGSPNLPAILERGLAQLYHLNGTIYLVIPQETTSGLPNQVSISAAGRNININCAIGRVAFQSGGKKVEQPLGRGRNGTHVIAFEWDDRSHMIGVSADGQPLIRRY